MLGVSDMHVYYRSVYDDPNSGRISSSLGPSSLDTALAGIGDEKQGTSNEFDEPASGISLTSDQESNIWSFYHPSSTPEASMGMRPSAATPRVTTASNDLLAVPLMLPHHKKRSQESMQHSKSSPERRIKPTQASGFESLQVLADVVSSQPQRTPQKIPELSNAPQTKKAQALHQLTRLLIHSVRTSLSSIEEDQASFAPRPVAMDRTKSRLIIMDTVLPTPGSVPGSPSKTAWTDETSSTSTAVSTVSSV